MGKVRDIDSIRYVFIPDFQRSCKKIDYYENFLNWLNSQNYQVLISPTGPYDSHVFRRSFFQQIAIIQLPMSTSLNQANCPDEYTDILISRSDHHLKSLREKFPEKISKIYDFRFPLSIFETNGFLNHERDREMVVIATVLGGDRIYNFFKQLTRYERDVFFKIFEEPRVHWFFVGTYRCQEILNLDDRFVLLNNSGRLSIIARSEDLANFYSHVDIYFNLPGVSGGGGAILQALVNGVAALSAFDSDSAPDLPKDALYANFREGFALLGSLISDQEKRKDILSGFEDIRRCRNIELCVNNAIEITNAAFHNSLTRLLNMK